MSSTSFASAGDTAEQVPALEELAAAAPPDFASASRRHRPRREGARLIGAGRPL